MIGDTGVGKTFLVNRFMRQKITDSTLPTLSVEYVSKKVQLENGHTIKVDLWDTGKYFYYIYNKQLVVKDIEVL